MPPSPRSARSRPPLEAGGPAPPLRPFRAPAWARGPHAQTILGRALRRGRVAGLRRERWPTPDGDFLDLDLTDDPEPEAPLVLVLHGLEGSSRRGYVQEALRAVRRRGMAGAALNFRGCSGEPNRLPRAYHSGETGDPALVVERLAERFPERPLGALGFSLGGNVLLKLLGEGRGGSRGRIDAAAAVSVPYDLAAGARLLERTRWGRLYGRWFLRSLRAKVRRKARLLDGRVDLRAALASRTLRAFDDALTAPLHGFRDADHYYAESSAARYLEGVRIPTLLVHAEDDPFLPAEVLPDDQVERNPWLTPAFVPRGGHVGFVDGAPWAPRFWAEESAAAFLAASLGA